MSDADATSGAGAPAVPPKQFLALLLLAAVVGLVVSLASWCFLQLVHYLPEWIYEDLPDAVGYDNGAPLWWYLPACALAGLVVAFAIVRLPGRGGHVPAHGLNAGATEPIDLPGVMLAAFATLGFGLVLGPEAPLLALGGGLAILAIRLVRKDAPDDITGLMAACGAFAALSFIFESPLAAAIILIEATGIGGPRLPMVMVPGLLAAGIGSLVSIGMGSFTGLNTSNYALGALALPDFARPDFVDFVWTIPFAVAVAVGMFVILRAARELYGLVESREFLLLPLAGLAVAGLAIAFDAATEHSVNDVLFSGETALPGLVDGRLVVVGRCARAGDRLQGTRLDHLPCQLPRWPRFPLVVPRWRGRIAGIAPGGLRPDGSGGRRHGRRDRVGTRVAAVGGRAGDAVDREQRGRGHSTNNCGRGRRLPHDARVVAAGPGACARCNRRRACLSRRRRESTGGSTAG